MTTPLRTLLDAGAEIGPTKLEEAMDVLLTRKATSFPKIQTYIEANGGRGRRGAGVLRNQRTQIVEQLRSVLLPSLIHTVSG